MALNVTFVNILKVTFFKGYLQVRNGNVVNWAGTKACYEKKDQLQDFLSIIYVYECSRESTSLPVSCSDHSGP